MDRHLASNAVIVLEESQWTGDRVDHPCRDARAAGPDGPGSSGREGAVEEEGALLDRPSKVAAWLDVARADVVGVDAIAECEIRVVVRAELDRAAVVIPRVLAEG